MSANADLSRIFSEIAAALELLEANPFKVGANAKVARILGDLTVDVATLADDKSRLTAIDGIGDGSAKKIIEFVKTGKVVEHEELIAQVPVGLIKVMNIPGVGPKTARLLWKEAGVVDMQSLKKALESGSLEKIKRMGAKTIANIVESLEFAEKSGERARLGQALPTAEALIAQLREVKGVQRIEYAGSLRRGKETIGDLDLLAVADNPAALAKAFHTMPNVAKVLAGGDNRSSVRLAQGIQCDLRIVPAESFGAAWLYFTGSKEHNIVLRERAQKKKLRLNEYGLFPEDGHDTPPQTRGIKPIAGKTEEDVYEALGFNWIPPEIREARGEFDVKTPPELITVDDIKAELHAHTNASDGHLTIDQLIEEAQRRGFHTIAVTDHSKSSVQANGLSPDRVLKHIDAVREAATRHKEMNILVGSEVDILIDGRLDYDDELLAKLDIVVASPHASLKQDPEKATTRLLSAIRHPLVHILGHPTGRIINRREGLHPDINAMIDAAVEHKTALEINANHLRLDLRDTHVKAAVEAGAMIAIDTDAHGTGDFDELRYGVLTGRRGWLTADRCVNAWTKAKLMKWLSSKR